MAFVFPANSTYTWPITFTLPNDGKHTGYTIDVVFNRLSILEYECQRVYWPREDYYHNKSFRRRHVFC